MGGQMETVLLDPTKYNENTNRWDVPILRLPSVKCASLHIDQQEIPSNQFSVKKNFITLSRDIAIDERTTGHLVVEIAPSNLLLTFWLPVIIAVIGLLGTIGQPVLHSLGLLYAPEPYYRIDPSSWSYDKLNDKFNLRIALQPVHEEMVVKKSELGDWQLFLCVREKDEAIDFSRHKYKFIGGPFILKTIMEHSVKTDRDFTRKLIETKKSAQCCIVLVHKGTPVGDNFCPSDFGCDVVKVPRAVAVAVE